MKITAKFFGLLLPAVLSGFAGAGIYDRWFRNSEAINVIENKPVVQAKPLAVNMPVAEYGASVDFTGAAERSVHAVVHVRTWYEQNSQGLYYGDPFHDFFWGDPGHRQQQPMREGTGSGVVITDDGYVVTNNHVIKNADKIEVTLNDKRAYHAKLIGSDPTTDLALLKIEEKNLPFVSYGNSDELKVGEWVLAVGNPFNLTSTVTAGIVSAKARNINVNAEQFAIESFIQTDAAVNPGNSGGALVNTRGELIGVNAAIASNTGSYTGYSFAIPVNIVKKVAGDLLEYGEVQRGFLGVSIRDLDSKIAADRGLKELKGVYISGLLDNGAAKVSGLEEGDVITQVGDIEVNSSTALQEQVGRYRPGDRVNITVLRSGKQMIVPVVLRNKNGSTELIKDDPRTEVLSLLGAGFENISAEDKTRLKIKNGVKIGRLDGGKLRSVGIREGFIVTHIDKKEINSMNDIADALKNKKGGVLIEGIYPNGIKAYYGFGL